MEGRDLGMVPERIDENDDRVSEWDLVERLKKLESEFPTSKAVCLCVQKEVSVCLCTQNK